MSWSSSLMRLFGNAQRNGGGTKQTPLSESGTLDMSISVEDYCQTLLLLDRGEGLQYRDTFGNTVLHTAAMKRSPFCGLLVKLGVNPNCQNEYHETPLHMLMTGTFQWTTLTEEDARKLQALHLASSDVRKARDRLLQTGGEAFSVWVIANELLIQGADPNACLLDGKTPLINAVRYQAPLVHIALLVRHGALPRVCDYSRRDVVEWAHFVGSDHVAFFLTWIQTVVVLLAAQRRNVRKGCLIVGLPKELLRTLCENTRPPSLFRYQQ